MTHQEILATIPEGYRAEIADGILHIREPQYIAIVLKDTTEFKVADFGITIRTNGTSAITLYKDIISTHTVIF